ncbi:hypothetical protein JW865_00530 [Candidatus Bathyarchaeota archaeon]|nr:hypothetical protein [Candidatus Bathyarchaeota archaeon]
MSWVPLLLTDHSTCLRYLVHKNLLNDSEAEELRNFRLNDPLIKDLTIRQLPDGSWAPASIYGHSQGKIQATAQALTRLGYLEVPFGHESVRRAAEYLFSQQKPDGSWPLIENSNDSEDKEHYDIMSLQTSIPLRGLAESGYSEDPRSMRAYEWLLNQQMEDGAWPTGIAKGVYGYVAGYRRIPHSRWGCRSNTTAAVTCLSLNQKLRKSTAARRGLDLLLGRETRERTPLGYDIARLVGYEPSTGFITYYARFDNAHILKLCSRLEAGLHDPRVKNLVEYTIQEQGSFGLWEYLPNPQATKWVTYDILYNLSQIMPTSDWETLEPQTPFQPYPKKRKRY